MDLNNLTPEQLQQVVQLLQQIQGQGPNTNVAEQLTSAMQQQASTTLVENIKILALLKLLSARAQQQPSNVVQGAPFVESQGLAPSSNNNAIGDSSVLLQQILELKQQMINNPNDEGFGLQGQPPQQFDDRREHYTSHHDNGNYRREHSPPRWHGDRDGERGHSPPHRERSPPQYSGSGRQRPPKWTRDQSRLDKPAQGAIPTQLPPIGQGAVFTAQNPTEILASYLTDEDVVIPKFNMMRPVISGIHSSTSKRTKPVQEFTSQLSSPPPGAKPNSKLLPATPSPVKVISPSRPTTGKVPPSLSPKKMPLSPLKGPSTASPNGKVPPPVRKGPPLTSPGAQKPAKISLEGIPPPYPLPKHPPKQQFHNNSPPVNKHPQPQPTPPKHYAPKANTNLPPRTTFPPQQQNFQTQPNQYQPTSHAPPQSHVQHASYAQPAPYKQPVQAQHSQSVQSYYPPPQVPNAAPTISPGTSGHGSSDPFQGATVEDLQQVHQFLTEVLEMQQGAKDKSQRPNISTQRPPQPGKPAQQVGPALPPQASSYVPPQVKKPLHHPPPSIDTLVSFKKQKTDHYPPTPSPKKAPLSFPPTGPMPVALTPHVVPPQPVPYGVPAAVPPTYPPPGYPYMYPYPAYDYNTAYQYYYGAAYPPQPGAQATVTYPPPGYYPAPRS
jgi:hypothetical protein